MNPFMFVYIELLFRPLFNLLVGITNILPNHSVGIAIILVTAFVRLILLPPSLHQVKQARHNQTKMKDVQQQIERVKKMHKDNRSKQAEETMAIYRQAGINPAAGCLPLLIQLPILIALYRVFFVGLGAEQFVNLYQFVAAPTSLQMVFLSIPLSEPSLLLGVIAGIGQFALMRFFTPSQANNPVGGDDQSAKMMAAMQKNMAYFFPVMTVFIALQLPAALSLYWVASTGLAILQQYLFKKILKTDANIPVM